MDKRNPNSDVLQYWQVNVPASKREADCPAYLQNLKPKELAIISTPDSEYHIHSWAEVQQLVATNALDAFQRIPSDLRRYLVYNHHLTQKHGSVMNFVLRERLTWSEPINPDGKPFEKESDIRILWNDWPYGTDAKIVHLVIWTKFELEDDPTTDDLTDDARGKIETFVRSKFGDVVGEENVGLAALVIWFKNWRSLKSIHAVEHFHVMLYNPDPDFVTKITNGDVPLSRKV